jgi:hypothetical protein
MKSWQRRIGWSRLKLFVQLRCVTHLYAFHFVRQISLLTFMQHILTNWQHITTISFQVQDAQALVC